MCSNYLATIKRERLRRFGVQLELDLNLPKVHVWKGYPAPFIRRHPHANVGDEAVPANELLTGQFGLIPSWSKERTIKYSTFNARSETAATAASFRGAWAAGQRCIVPADWIIEPDWRSGKHVPTRIARSDGQPMGIAGLWDKWTDKTTGEVLYSFTMLTINADGHELMQNYHRPNDEKRMVVILPEASYGEWLTAPVASTREFLNRYPAERLATEAV